MQNLKTFCLGNSIDDLTISSSNFKNHHLKIETVRTMFKYVFNNTNIKIQICHENTLSDLTPEQITQILKQFHVTPLGGHQGVNRTFHRIKQHYQWRKMYKDIK